MSVASTGARLRVLIIALLFLGGLGVLYDAWQGDPDNIINTVLSRSGAQLLK